MIESFEDSNLKLISDGAMCCYQRNVSMAQKNWGIGLQHLFVVQIHEVHLIKWVIEYREVCKGAFLQSLNGVTKLVLIVECLENQSISYWEYFQDLKLHGNVEFLSTWRNDFDLLSRIHAPHISTAGSCAKALQYLKTFRLRRFFNIGKMAVNELKRPFVVTFLTAVMQLV